MRTKVLRLGLSLVLALALNGTAPVHAQSDALKLSPPELRRGKVTMQAIQDRKSVRLFSAKELSRQDLANVVWAAAGINRRIADVDQKYGRTAPSSHNDQAIDAYVFLRTGVYKYDPLQHELNLILAGDHRGKSGVQSYVADAPLNLLLVADMGKVSGETDRDKLMNVCMDVGHMSENVYLYGASVGLNVICRSTIDRDELRLLLKLEKQFEPLLGLTVGY